MKVQDLMTKYLLMENHVLKTLYHFKNNNLGILIDFFGIADCMDTFSVSYNLPNMCPRIHLIPVQVWLGWYTGI